MFPASTSGVSGDNFPLRADSRVFFSFSKFSAFFNPASLTLNYRKKHYAASVQVSDIKHSSPTIIQKVTISGTSFGGAEPMRDETNSDIDTRDMLLKTNSSASKRTELKTLTYFLLSKAEAFPLNY